MSVIFAEVCGFAAVLDKIRQKENRKLT
jgi:hypothetical protein